MSLFDDAKLVMFGSAGASKPTGGINGASANGRLYSVKPTDASGDFSTRRGSNLAGTRVGPDGLIEKGRENLVHYSNNFAQVAQGGGWGHSGINNTSTGQDGYDGTTNATAVFASTAANANHQVFLGNSNSAPSSVSITDVFTLSVHVKPNGYDHVMLRTDRTQAKASFNISTGVVGTKGSECVASSMTAVGNGFYRCQAAFAPAGTVSFVNIAMMEADDTNLFTGNTSKGYILQDAQWELGLTATDLIPTSGAAATAGCQEDEVRFDFTNGNPCRILQEPTRENKITVSEYYGGWQFSGNTDSVFSFTQNHDISPDGTKNASRYSATVNYRSLRNTITLETSTSYVFSFYVKNIDATRLKYRVFNTDTGSGTGGDVISATSYYSSVSTSEWTRIEVPFTTDSSGTSYAVYVADGLTVTSSGDSGGNVLFWGAQVEKGTYATSYIPCHGAATERLGDTFILGKSGATLQDGGFITSSAGTLFIDTPANGYGVATHTHWDLKHVTNDHHRIRIYFQSNTQVVIRQTDTDETQTALLTVTGLPANGQRKVAVAWNGTSVKVGVNGVYYDSTTTPAVSAMDSDIAADLQELRRANNTGMQSDVNSVMLFNSQLTQAQLESLTAL